MVNPHKDLVILRGWPRSEYAGREYHFTRDEGDQLLHCRLKTTSEMAMLARGVSFYRPNEMPTERYQAYFRIFAEEQDLWSGIWSYQVRGRAA